MSGTEEKKYRQLALFSVIVAEMVITPSLIGGLCFWLSSGKDYRNIVTSVGVFLGLVVAIYRIYLIHRNQEKN